MFKCVVQRRAIGRENQPPSANLSSRNTSARATAITARKTTQTLMIRKNKLHELLFVGRTLQLWKDGSTRKTENDKPSTLTVQLLMKEAGRQLDSAHWSELVVRRPITAHHEFDTHTSSKPRTGSCPFSGLWRIPLGRFGAVSEQLGSANNLPLNIVKKKRKCGCVNRSYTSLYTERVKNTEKKYQTTHPNCYCWTSYRNQ